MRVQIENFIYLKGTPKSYVNSLIQFNEILSTCLTVGKLSELKKALIDCTIKYESNYFKFGFGNNHFWLSDKETNDRILIVTE